MIDITTQDKDGNIHRLRIDENGANVQPSDATTNNAATTPDNATTPGEAISIPEEAAAVLSQLPFSVTPDSPFILVEVTAQAGQEPEDVLKAMQLDGSRLSIAGTTLDFTEESLDVNGMKFVDWEQVLGQNLTMLQNQEDLEALAKNSASVEINDDSMAGAKIDIGDSVIVSLTARPTIGNIVAVKYPDRSYAVIRRYNADGFYAERRDGLVKENMEGAKIMGVGYIRVALRAKSNDTTSND